MNFLQKKKVSIYGTKEACRPLWNQTRWRYCSPQSLSPGNSGTNTNKCGKSLDSRKNQKINITENRQWAGECVTKKTSRKTCFQRLFTAESRKEDRRLIPQLFAANLLLHEVTKQTLYGNIKRPMQFGKHA